MKVIGIEKLYDYDYSILVVNGLKQAWDKHSTFNCIGAPKAINMLLYLENGKAHYTDNHGREYFAQSGDIIYTPVDCEYSVEFYELKRPGGFTVGVNLMFFDGDGLPFRLSDEIKVFSNCADECRALFDRIDRTCRTANPSPALMKSAMYGILYNLSNSCIKVPLDQKKFGIIEKGIRYLENDSEQKLSINEIASLCSVSEIYFRKLFKKYSGVSPNEYRIHRKIERAKLLLDYEPLSISEISDHLGFTDSAYFAKVFKERVGISPKEFRGK